MYHISDNIFFILYIFYNQKYNYYENNYENFFFFLRYKIPKFTLCKLINFTISYFCWGGEGIIIMTENNESNN